MNKKLFTQIKNEWRSNLWLVTELLLVSVVLWYIVDYMYVQTSIYNEPRGFDISHCYLVQMGRLTDKSPDFIPNQTDEEKRQDIKELLSRLQHRPDIEAAGLGQNSYPYNGSNSSASVVYDTLRSPGWTIRRLVSPDFVRVFRYRGTRGETPEQLAEMLKHPKNFLASDNLYKRRYGCDLTSLVDKQFYLFGDTTNTYNLAASLQVELFLFFLLCIECVSFFLDDGHGILEFLFQCIGLWNELFNSSPILNEQLLGGFLL